MEGSLKFGILIFLEYICKEISPNLDTVIHSFIYSFVQQTFVGYQPWPGLHSNNRWEPRRGCPLSTRTLRFAPIPTIP